MTTAASPASVSLYGHWICPFATRVAFALAERGIEHDLVDVPPSAVRPNGFVLPPEFVEHSPRLEIPMVRVDDEFLADSIPILEWLEVRLDQKPLLPAGAEAKTLVRERMAWLDLELFRAMVGVYYGTDPDRIDGSALALRDALTEMDGWLAETTWLAGDRPTLAEAVLVLHDPAAARRPFGEVGRLVTGCRRRGRRGRASTASLRAGSAGTMTRSDGR